MKYFLFIHYKQSFIMPYRKSYLRPVRVRRSVRSRPRRKLQQAIVPHNPNNALANAAIGVAANYARNYVNNMVANRNRDVQFANAKKRAFRSPGYNPTSAVTKVGGAAAELKTYTAKIGRKRKVTLKQIEKLTFARRITRFQNLGPIDKGVDRGANWLGTIITTSTTLTPSLVGGNNIFVKNNSDLSGAANFYRCPYHLYLLNSTSLTDQVSPLGPAIQPFIDMLNGKVDFVNLHGCKPDLSGTSSQWQIESQNFGDVPNQKYIKQEWYDIRIALRNAIQQTTVFDIWVFQFKEGHLDPHSVPATVEELKDHKAFYQNLMSGGVNHPLMNKGQNDVMRKIKIWRKYRVVMDKQQTTDSDASPDIKCVKMFIRDGKLYDYQYATAPANNVQLPATYTLQNNSWIPQGAANVINTELPKQRARLWLMIRALDTTTSSMAGGGGDEVITSDDTLSSNTTPSYDIQIRKCESARI